MGELPLFSKARPLSYKQLEEFKETWMCIEWELATRRLLEDLGQTGLESLVLPGCAYRSYPWLRRNSPFKWDEDRYQQIVKVVSEAKNVSSSK